MPTKASARIRWAVDALAVQPDDRLLEIGCGHGVAVSLVCETLNGGHITAIDRSQKMVNLARSRNAACIAAGKATIALADMRDADFGGQTFDKSFAIHVNFFWQQPQQALAIVKGWLSPNGTMSLLFQPLNSSSVRTQTNQAVSNFEANGFAIVDQKRESITGGPMICLTAKPE